jgi:lysylphosphatidylglycerol synthetase-like protein (DUF2156 family)
MQDPHRSREFSTVVSVVFHFVGESLDRQRPISHHESDTRSETWLQPKDNRGVGFRLGLFFSSAWQEYICE